jgi:hypothetical protein
LSRISSLLQASSFSTGTASISNSSLLDLVICSGPCYFTIFFATDPG